VLALDPKPIRHVRNKNVSSNIRYNNIRYNHSLHIHYPMLDFHLFQKWAPLKYMSPILKLKFYIGTEKKWLNSLKLIRMEHRILGIGAMLEKFCVVCSTLSSIRDPYH